MLKELIFMIMKEDQTNLTTVLACKERYYLAKGESGTRIKELSCCLGIQDLRVM